MSDHDRIEERREANDRHFGAGDPPAPPADRRCKECGWYRPVEDFDGEATTCTPCKEDDEA